MTANQRTALEIASQVLRCEIAGADLDDEQFALVSLASSLGHSRCSPKIICAKIVADFRAASGFFADISEYDLLAIEPSLPPTPPLPALPEFPPQFGVGR